MSPASPSMTGWSTACSRPASSPGSAFITGIFPRRCRITAAGPIATSCEWFADYAHLIARRLGDRVKHFVTFNEPSVFTLFGYSFGWHPPATDDPASLYAAIHHVNLAHGAAVDTLRADVAKASIGAVHTIQPSRPDHTTEADRAAAAALDAIWNRAFPDPQILGAYPRRWRARSNPSSATATWRASAGRSTGSASTITRRYTRERILRRSWASLGGLPAGRAPIADRMADRSGRLPRHPAPRQWPLRLADLRPRKRLRRRREAR